MRVIEQLVQHFWARGAITRDEARYLVDHGFIREDNLPGYEGRKKPAASAPETFPDDWTDRLDRIGEELEQTPERPGGGKKGGGKKKQRPTPHDLGPVTAVLVEHFTAREPYRALLELAEGIRPRVFWPEAARVIASARPDDIEVALVSLLNTRPRALGELWFWFDLENLFNWAERKENVGPVAGGLAKMMRVSNRNQVGRAGQLMKAPEVCNLADLLDARRAVLGMLRRLYDQHFGSLTRWLVPPAGIAVLSWQPLPWAFVLLYNARQGTVDTPPPGYPVDGHALPYTVIRDALSTAYQMDPGPVRELLIHRLREQEVPEVQPYDWRGNAVFDRPLHCPLNWRV